MIREGSRKQKTHYTYNLQCTGFVHCNSVSETYSQKKCSILQFRFKIGDYKLDELMDLK